MKPTVSSKPRYIFSWLVQNRFFKHMVNNFCVQNDSTDRTHKIKNKFHRRTQHYVLQQFME